MFKQLSYITLFFIISILLTLPKQAHSSVVMGPQFFIQVEILNLGKDIMTRADASTYSRNYVEFKILNIVNGYTDRLKKGDILRRKLDIKFNALLKKGDKLVVGVEIGSSMGRSGPVEFILLSPINDEKGRKILDSFD